MSSDVTTPVIVSAVRTPIGKYLGGLAPLRAPQLGALVIREAVRRAAIAATAFWWLSSAKRSWSARDTPAFLAVYSARFPM